MKSIHLLALLCLGIVTSLENGLGRTPPMGWLAWERFKCNTNCKSDPKNCISENLFIEMADRLVADGYKDAGYTYVNIDDCWMSHKRDKKGNMVADPERFPRGIKFLADHMHAVGLKLGIYQDFGHHTCMGYPGIVGHMEQDAKKFAEWEVDMVKLDGCNSHPGDLDAGYIRMGKYLNATGRPVLYSCSWPYYQLLMQMEPDYEVISKHCNLWRTFHDIQDSWTSIEKIIEFFGDNQEVLSVHTGPGHWTDPDMIMIGNFHLTPGQARIQMAVWSMIPAPLLMSNDLRSMKQVFRDILLNRKVIAVNQDALGLPGMRIYKEGKIEVWTRPILPMIDYEVSYAVLFLNKNDGNKSAVLKFPLNELFLNSETGYFVTSIFSKDEYLFHENTTVEVKVPPMDVVMWNCRVNGH